MLLLNRFFIHSYSFVIKFAKFFLAYVWRLFLELWALISSLLHTYKKLSVKNKTVILFIVWLLIISVPSFVSFILYLNIRDKISSDVADLSNAEVGLVMGAGINSLGKPSKVLRQRLDAGNELLKSGKVGKLVLSGSVNEAKKYSEPKVMYEYLLENGINAENLILDIEGNNTEASCRNVVDIYGYKNIIVVTNSFHIKRSVYLCSIYGINTQGLIAQTDFENSQFFSWYVIRDNLGVMFYFFRLNQFR